MIKGANDKYKGVVIEATFHDPYTSTAGVNMTLGKIVLNNSIIMDGIFYRDGGDDWGSYVGSSHIEIGRAYRFRESVQHTNYHGTLMNLYWGIEKIRVKK